MHGVFVALSVCLYRYNSDAEYSAAFALGVDGVMTDRPAHLRRFLDNGGGGGGGGEEVRCAGS